jgi:hypothetical protein
MLLRVRARASLHILGGRLLVDLQGVCVLLGLSILHRW